MKKVLFFFTVILLLAVPAELSAQETLTVYDGTSTNNNIPAYIYYFDSYTRSQFVIPSDDLADMDGGFINSIKFYTTANNIPYTSECMVNVYVKEVDYTSMTGLEPAEGATLVYTGVLDIVSTDVGGELTIEFSSPFPYNGGNLLVGCDNFPKLATKTLIFMVRMCLRRLGQAKTPMALIMSPVV